MHFDEQKLIRVRLVFTIILLVRRGGRKCTANDFGFVGVKRRRQAAVRTDDVANLLFFPRRPLNIYRAAALAWAVLSDASVIFGGRVAGGRGGEGNVSITFIVVAILYFATYTYNVRVIIRIFY